MCIRFLSFFTSRGFGFITFGDPNSVDKVLAHGTHELDGKKVRTIIYRLQVSPFRVHSTRLSTPKATAATAAATDTFDTPSAAAAASVWQWVSPGLARLT